MCGRRVAATVDMVSKQRKVKRMTGCQYRDKKTSEQNDINGTLDVERGCETDCRSQTRADRQKGQHTGEREGSTLYMLVSLLRGPKRVIIESNRIIESNLARTRSETRII